MNDGHGLRESFLPVALTNAKEDGGLYRIRF